MNSDRGEEAGISEIGGSRNKLLSSYILQVSENKNPEYFSIHTNTQRMLGEYPQFDIRAYLLLQVFHSTLTAFGDLRGFIVKDYFNTLITQLQGGLLVSTLYTNSNFNRREIVKILEDIGRVFGAIGESKLTFALESEMYQIFKIILSPTHFQNPLFCIVQYKNIKCL